MKKKLIKPIKPIEPICKIAGEGVSVDAKGFNTLGEFIRAIPEGVNPDDVRVYIEAETEYGYCNDAYATVSDVSLFFNTPTPPEEQKRLNQIHKEAMVEYKKLLEKYEVDMEKYSKEKKEQAIAKTKAKLAELEQGK